MVSRNRLINFILFNLTSRHKEGICVCVFYIAHCYVELGGGGLLLVYLLELYTSLLESIQMVEKTCCMKVWKNNAKKDREGRKMYNCSEWICV